MAKLKSTPEVYFMNQLSVSMRPAAKHLFQNITLEELLVIKKGTLSKPLMMTYQLDVSQWQLIADAVILARLPQYRLLNHYEPSLLFFLKQLLLEVLDMQRFSCEEAAKIIEKEAPTLATWMMRLQKVLANK